MRVQEHIIYTLLFALVLYPFIGLNAIFFFLGGWVIDIDHLLFYWWEQGFSLDILKINKEYLGRKKMVTRSCLVCHTVEFLLVVALIALIFDYYYILTGILFHWVIDFIQEPERVEELSILFGIWKTYPSRF